MSKERFKLIPAVFLVLKDNDGQLLLSQRLNTGYGNGYYSLVSGHVEDGESTVSAMIREAREETGIALQKDDLRLSHVLHYTSEVDGYKSLMLFFEAEKWKGDIMNTEPDKCSDLSWFSLDALPANTIPYVRQVLECIQNKIAYSEFGWE